MCFIVSGNRNVLERASGGYSRPPNGREVYRLTKRKVTNEQLVAAILSSKTKAEAAQKCGVTRRVIYQRMSNDAEFRQLLKQGAVDVLQGAVQSMRAGICEAADFTRSLIKDDTEQTCYRLQAAQLILTTFAKLNAEFERQERAAMPASTAEKTVLEWLDENLQQLEALQNVHSVRYEEWQKFDDSFKIHPNGDGTYNFGSRARGEQK